MQHHHVTSIFSQGRDAEARVVYLISGRQSASRAKEPHTRNETTSTYPASRSRTSYLKSHSGIPFFTHLSVTLAVRTQGS